MWLTFHCQGTFPPRGKGRKQRGRTQEHIVFSPIAYLGSLFLIYLWYHPSLTGSPWEPHDIHPVSSSHGPTLRKPTKHCAHLVVNLIKDSRINSHCSWLSNDSVQSSSLLTERLTHFGSAEEMQNERRSNERIWTFTQSFIARANSAKSNQTRRPFDYEFNKRFSNQSSLLMIEQRLRPVI